MKIPMMGMNQINLQKNKSQKAGFGQDFTLTAQLGEGYRQINAQECSRINTANRQKHQQVATKHLDIAAKLAELPVNQDTLRLREHFLGSAQHRLGLCSPDVAGSKQILIDNGRLMMETNPVCPEEMDAIQKYLN